MDFVNLTSDKLDVQHVTELVTSPKCGAISIFVGTTRDNFDGKTVVTLEYEAYEGMARKCMNQICSDVREKWPGIENIAIHHRLGTVPVGEASVIIATSSPHRADAIQATQLCIETLKKSVPVWKKEVYLRDPPEWKENKECTWAKSENPSNNFEVDVPFIYYHLIDSNASLQEVLGKVDQFIKKKRLEINEDNIRDFCEVNEENCARNAAKLSKRKDSKGHLQVNRVLNNWNRDQGDFQYLSQHIPTNGTEERLKNLERQLKYSHGCRHFNFSDRLKLIESKILHLESVSPEYAQCLPFEERKCQKSPIKRREVTVSDIDNIIEQIERKKARLAAREKSKN